MISKESELIGEWEIYYDGEEVAAFLEDSSSALEVSCREKGWLTKTQMPRLVYITRQNKEKRLHEDLRENGS